MRHQIRAVEIRGCWSRPIVKNLGFLKNLKVMFLGFLGFLIRSSRACWLDGEEFTKVCGLGRLQGIVGYRDKTILVSNVWRATVLKPKNLKTFLKNLRFLPALDKANLIGSFEWRAL